MEPCSQHTGSGEEIHATHTQAYTHDARHVCTHTHAHMCTRTCAHNTCSASAGGEEAVDQEASMGRPASSTRAQLHVAAGGK